MRTRKLYPARLKPKGSVLSLNVGVLEQISNVSTYEPMTEEKFMKMVRETGIFYDNAPLIRPKDWTVQTHKPRRYGQQQADAAMAFGMSLLAQKQLEDGNK